MKQLIFFIAFLLVIIQHNQAQESKINWISFEQLEDSLAVQPKKVLISFHAGWCSYCKKMDKTAYQNTDVISILNKEYYAVKMNAESKDTIVFEGKKFYNEEVGKKRRPNHQLALLLATRKGYPFSLPATIILDEDFQIESRYFLYLSPKKMKRILK